MAILTPVDLGTGSNATGAALGVNTTATAPAGALIVAVAFWKDAATRDSSYAMSGGGLTWTQDAEVAGTASDPAGVTFFTAPAPSGLASGTTLTLNFTNAAWGGNLHLAYVEGAGAEDSTSAGDFQGSGGTALSTGAGTIAAFEAVAFACFGGDGSGGADSISVTGPATELSEIRDGTNTWRSSLAYYIAGPGSLTIAGALSASVAFGRWGAWNAYASSAPPPDEQYTVTLGQAGERRRGPGLRGPGHESEAIGFIA